MQSLKIFSNKKIIKAIRSTFILYTVKANVFFENRIQLRAVAHSHRFKEFINHLPEKISRIFSGIECPKALRFLLPTLHRGVDGAHVLGKYLSLKLEPAVDLSQRFIAKLQYWIINPAKLRANGGVAIFSYDSFSARKTFGFVALAHALIFLIIFSLTSIQDKRKPEITIELGDSPSASNGPSSSGSEQAVPSPMKNASKAPSPSEDVNSELVKAQELKRLEKKLEKQKELELEREKRKEAEREKQKQKEKERELNLERVKELERDRQRARELEQEKKRELERERQRVKELEQEKKKEQDRAKEQERQQKIRERQQEKLKEKLPEPKKLEKDGTLPPPPAPASPPASPPAAPSAPASSAPPPSSSTSGGATSPSSASGSPATGGGSPPPGSGNSMSASVSNGPASAPTLDSDAKPVYQNNPKPPYPLLAFKMKIQGKVILVVDVAESGSVNKVSVAESSGNESLDLSALEAVKNWKFTPARKNGVIVGQVVRVPITFSLKNR